MSEIEESLTVDRLGNRAIRLVKIDAPLGEADGAGDARCIIKPLRVGIIVREQNRLSDFARTVMGQQLGNKQPDFRMAIRRI